MVPSKSPLPSAGLLPLTSFTLPVHPRTSQESRLWLGCPALPLRSAFISTQFSRLGLFTVPQVHQRPSYLRAFALASPDIYTAFSLILFMSLIQCYHFSKAFNGHLTYNSPPSLSDTLPCHYFSLSISYHLNIVYVSVCGVSSCARTLVPQGQGLAGFVHHCLPRTFCSPSY